MNSSALIKGLSIFEKYRGDFSLAAVHDQILIDPEIAAGTLSLADVELVDELGFYYDTEHGCWCGFV